MNKKKMRLKLTCFIAGAGVVCHVFNLFLQDCKEQPGLGKTAILVEMLQVEYKWLTPVLSADAVKEKDLGRQLISFMLPVIRFAEVKDTWMYDSDCLREEIFDWKKLTSQIEQECMEAVSQESTEETEEIFSEIQVQETPERENEKQMEYSAEQLHDPMYIKEHFFTVDATTAISPEQLTYEQLMEYDASIEKKQNMDTPQILIYHTHSREDFLDSGSSQGDKTILGVGERLSQLLRDNYGYQVLHLTDAFDAQSRDYAYANAAKGLESILHRYPSIDVMIDLHRDAVKEETRLVYGESGSQVARFMFFNGMSYTNKMGKLESLPNPYLRENMAFAFQCMLAAEEYFPGITRKTYLKGYRYNMQYRPKSLLIEVGAQTNTYEEAYRSCEPLAFVLDLVLSGAYPEKEKLQ